MDFFKHFCLFVKMFILSQWSLGRSWDISSTAFLESMWTPEQRADRESPDLRHGKKTLSWRWICTFGDVCVSYHASSWATYWKCSRAGAGSQHWFWSNYETTSIQDYHFPEILDRLKTQMMIFRMFWNVTAEINCSYYYFVLSLANVVKAQTQR